MQKSRARRVGALIVGLALFTAACGSDEEDAAPATDAATETTAAAEEAADTTAAEAADTTAAEEAADTTVAEEAEAEAPSKCGQADGTVTDGDLEGFAGATPFGSGGTSEDFISRLCEIDNTLIDLNYAAESYDAVVITALAMEIAGTDGIEHASEINGVTRDGEKCTDFVSCKEIIDAGGDIDYDGVAGPLTFTGNGEPLQASYGFLTMGANNRIDPALTEYIEVDGTGTENDVPEVPVTGTRAGDGKVKIAGILPITGSLAFLGPPMIIGYELGIKEVNAAGGVLGVQVEAIAKDSGDTSTDEAVKSADVLLSENVDAIIGTASSSVTKTILDKVTAAGVTLFSPANTSPELSTLPDNGLYFRTAPPDVYQGTVIGQKVVQDGNQTVAILALNDSYGTGLADQATAAITAGGGEVVLTKIYDPAATSFATEVDEVVAADPDAIIVIGFNESSLILRTMVEKGVGPKVKNVYGCDGNIGNGLGVDFDAGK
jgi:ABC-type branched-subunit amino acid transport system substrate-binding protein